MIDQKCVLVQCHISTWTPRKRERQIESEIESNHNSRDSGRYYKNLISKESQRPHKTGAKIRNYVYQHTLPWGKNAERLLPIGEGGQNFQKFKSGLRKLEEQFDKDVRDFGTNFDAIKAKSRQSLNGLYNPADYPRNPTDHFSADVAFKSVPSNDIRVELTESERAEIQQSVEKQTQDNFNAALKAATERITEQVVNMIEVLESEGRIFKSLTGNLEKILDLTESLNLYGDASITELVNECRALCIPAETLKDKNTALTVKEKAKQILDNMA